MVPLQGFRGHVVPYADGLPGAQRQAGDHVMVADGVAHEAVVAVVEHLDFGFTLSGTWISKKL